VGKDIVQNLNFTKNHKTNPHQQPSQVPPPKLTAQPINPQPKQPTTTPKRFEPFTGHVSHSESNQWDPFGQSNAANGVGSLIISSPPGPTPGHGVPPSGGPGHNPFSAFTIPPSPDNNNTIFPNPTTITTGPVDPHTLFKSTPVTTQPTVAQPYYPGTPYTDSSVVYSYRIVSPYGSNPWVQPITVQPQVTVTQTGPDAFSGLLPGFSTKPSSTAVNPIK